MHNITFIENQTVLHFPENATEFTEHQFLAFVKYLLQYQDSKIDFNQFAIKVVYAFLDLSRKADLNKDQNHPVIENVIKIAELVDGYFTTKTENGKRLKVISMDFYTQKLPVVKANGKTYYGPTDALFNSKYGEYLKLMHHFNAFAESNDVKELDNLIATIYRPQKPKYKRARKQLDFDGDRRVAFNSNLTPLYVQDLKTLSYPHKYAIFLFVASCQKFIANCEALDIGSGNTVDLSVLFVKSKTTHTTAPSIGMLGTLYSLAETKVFGDIDKVAQKNTFDILVFLVNQTNNFNNLKSKSNAIT